MLRTAEIPKNPKNPKVLGETSPPWIPKKESILRGGGGGGFAQNFWIFWIFWNSCSFGPYFLEWNFCFWIFWIFCSFERFFFKTLPEPVFFFGMRSYLLFLAFEEGGGLVSPRTFGFFGFFGIPQFWALFFWNEIFVFWIFWIFCSFERFFFSKPYQNQGCFWNEVIFLFVFGLRGGGVVSPGLLDFLDFLEFPQFWAAEIQTIQKTKKQSKKKAQNCWHSKNPKNPKVLRRTPPPPPKGPNKQKNDKIQLKLGPFGEGSPRTLGFWTFFFFFCSSAFFFSLKYIFFFGISAASSFFDKIIVNNSFF